MVKTGIEDTLGGIESRRLLQHAYPQVTTEDDLSLIVALHTREDGQER